MSGYVYLYSVYYFLFKTKMTGFFQTCFYFGYTAMFCLALGVMCGAVGYAGSERVRAQDLQERQGGLGGARFGERRVFYNTTAPEKFRERALHRFTVSSPRARRRLQHLGEDALHELLGAGGERERRIQGPGFEPDRSRRGGGRRRLLLGPAAAN